MQYYCNFRNLYRKEKKKKKKKKACNSIMSESCLSDFFVVRYSSYNFSKQGDGKDNINSLKLPPSLRKHYKEPKDEMQKT